MYICNYQVGEQACHEGRRKQDDVPVGPSRPSIIYSPARINAVPNGLDATVNAMLNRSLLCSLHSLTQFNGAQSDGHSDRARSIFVHLEASLNRTTQHRIIYHQLSTCLCVPPKQWSTQNHEPTLRRATLKSNQAYVTQTHPCMLAQAYASNIIQDTMVRVKNYTD